MTVHIRMALVIDIDDRNGDVIAIRSEGLSRPHQHGAAIFLPRWTLHRLGGGGPDFYPHSVEAECVCDGYPAQSAWAARALEEAHRG